MRDHAILDGRYRVEEKLAAGGFGSIYRATDLVMGRQVALKVLHRELAEDPSVVERFRREADALARLRDPHTITMYDVGESWDGTHYIVMELLRGASLHELFHAHGKRMPWRRVVTIARGVCRSLREAHAIGIVHRDLKPANIHLEKHALEVDYVKVLDFGIAKTIDTGEPDSDLTRAGQMVGTFEYMPPEQMLGGRCTGKSDVFSLGVVLYEMITGERPYGDAKGPASALMQVLGTTPVALADRANVPGALDRIVMRALQREPELRPDIFELDEELARILDATFDDREAMFGDDDGPTWIEPRKPVRITPLRVSNPTRAPANVPRPVHVADTMLRSSTTVTPAHGVPIVPRAPATPVTPSDFAVGTATQLPPVQATPPVQAMPPTVIAPPVIAPLVVRFASGTRSPVTPPLPAAAMSYTARDTVIRGVAYVMLVALVVTVIYLVS